MHIPLTTDSDTEGSVNIVVDLSLLEEVSGKACETELKPISTDLAMQQ